MTHLLDLFSPAELLHLVSVANKQKLLSTQDKKYLLAIRMGSLYEKGFYHLDNREKEKFVPLFARFMNFFHIHHVCSKDPCPVCLRLRALKEDFMGAGQSEEYSLVMDWMSGVSVLQAPEKSMLPSFDDEDSDNNEEADESSGEEDFVPAEPAVLEEDLSEESIPEKEILSDPGILPVESVPVSKPVIESPESVPLFTINPRHPLIREWEGFLVPDLIMLDERDILKYALECQVFLKKMKETLF